MILSCLKYFSFLDAHILFSYSNHLEQLIPSIETKPSRQVSTGEILQAVLGCWRWQPNKLRLPLRQGNEDKQEAAFVSWGLWGFSFWPPNITASWDGPGQQTGISLAPSCLVRLGAQPAPSSVDGLNTIGCLWLLLALPILGIGSAQRWMCTCLWWEAGERQKWWAGWDGASHTGVHSVLLSVLRWVCSRRGGYSSYPLEDASDVAFPWIYCSFNST